MRQLFYTLLAFTLLYSGDAFSQAGHGVSIRLDKNAYAPGDTIWFAGNTHDSLAGRKALTINLFMEGLHKTGRWRLRYPLLMGQTNGGIIIPADIPADQYALNFSLQQDFFNVVGKVDNISKGDSIHYTMLFQNKDIGEGMLAVQQNNEFRIPKLLFEGSAVVFFRYANKKVKRLPQVSLIATLDSAFTSRYDTSLVLSIGNVSGDTAASQYHFDREEFLNPGGTLENVEVVAKARTQLEKLDDEYVRSPMFSGSDGYAFSGDDLMKFSGMDALSFLRGRVAGLQIQYGETGELVAEWRGSTTTLFLDEMPVDAVVLSGIPASDIALLKVFRPPFFGAFGGGPGGAIAVYTRRGSSGTSAASKARFVLNGYTPFIYTLPSGNDLP